MDGHAFIYWTNMHCPFGVFLYQSINRGAVVRPQPPLNPFTLAWSRPTMDWSGPVRTKERMFEQGRDPMEPKGPVGRTSRRHFDVLRRRGATSPAPFIPHSVLPR
jgi:hypothetical protein